MKIEMSPIGYIDSPYKVLEEIPRQSVLAKDKTAIIKILPQYIEGIEGIKKDTYGIILFYFHKATGDIPLKQISRNTNKLTGLFNTRSPKRPNGIGMSIVKFINVEIDQLEIEGVDMLDGTPVLDIKPYNKGLNPEEI